MLHSTLETTSATVTVIKPQFSCEDVFWRSLSPSRRGFKKNSIGQIDNFTLFYQPLAVRGWTTAFLLDVRRLCGVIEGRLSHFLPRWLRTGQQSAISQGKIS